jgi:hypothetical protein
MYLNLLDNSYTKQGLGRAALLFHKEIFKAGIEVAEDGGHRRNDGGHLTGDAPCFVARMVTEGILFRNSQFDAIDDCEIDDEWFRTQQFFIRPDCGRTKDEDCATLLVVPPCRCTVSFADPTASGAVEVTAETLFEAGCLALKAFQGTTTIPPLSPTVELEIIVRQEARHRVKVSRLQSWLSAGVRSPREQMLKVRLKEMLE